MIGLKDILQAKERRWHSISQMLSENEATLLSITLNMPGQEKNSPRACKLFHEALNKIGNHLQITKALVLYETAGPHALFCVNEVPEKAKAVTCKLEEHAPYARLWNIDVYNKEGTALSHVDRQLGRKCFLCEKPSYLCIREKQHTEAEILQKVEDLFFDFYAAQSNYISAQAEKLGKIALEAILFETSCDPSPGLVCPFSKGSHQDMDFFTFQRSSAALAHHLARFAEAGLQHNEAPELLFPVLQKIGLDCEESMFKATKGINTQKGLIFSMGLILGASGLALKENQPLKAENICSHVRTLAKDLVKKQLNQTCEQQKTGGIEAYAKFSITGIRGEAEKGFPSVLKAGLPTLKDFQAHYNDINKSLLATLLSLMCVVDDTTIIKRSGQDKKTLDWVKKTAARYLKDNAWGDENWQQKIRKLDSELVTRNISPGGSADLLAICWYFYTLEENF